MNIGQYAMVSHERLLDFNGRKFRVVLYGAYNAGGLIGPEKNGICVLDEDKMNVVLDGHFSEGTGYFGPSDDQVIEWQRICSLSEDGFFSFCNSHERSRGLVDSRKATPKPKFSTDRYLTVVGKSVAYDAAAKSEFLRMSRQLAFIMAARLGLNEDQYEIRTNRGGIAVSGEVTLHTDTHYIQFAQITGVLEGGFLARSCKGRKDYFGGRNHFVKYESLRDLDKVCEFILSLS